MEIEVNRDCNDATCRFTDLVQVRTEDTFGTGLLVGPGIVLTALHCVCDPQKSWQVRKGIGVYLLHELQEGREVHLPAYIVWPMVDACGEDPPDVCVLQIVVESPPTVQARRRFGQIPTVPTLGSVLGFPKAAKGGHLPGGRVEHDQPGLVHYTSASHRALTLFPAGRHEMRGLERWSGLSGGPLLVNSLVVGVVREVPNGWGGEIVEAEPLAPLLQPEGDRSLRHLLGVDLPLEPSNDALQVTLASSYRIIGGLAHKASERVFEAALNRPLFGRSEDLQALDDAVTKPNCGILLLQGEAGLGKSRLAAEWADRCRRAPWTRVLRHAFSVREQETSTRDAMVSNLARQAAELLGPQVLGVGEPGDATRLRERLANLLSTDRFDDGRLIVVLDGLDEAAERIEPLSMDLGRGVFVLVTCRAEPGDEPRALQMWRERALDAGTLALDLALKPLDSTSMAEWLAKATGEAFAATDRMVARAMQASEGVPLLASYLIPDAIEALKAGVADPFPASFTEYARRQLTDLRDRLEGWWWSELVELFALLAIARAPLPAAGFRELLRPQGLDGLDLRAERWLWRRAGSESEPAVVSYAHPRLAAVFKTVLPQSAPDIPDILQCAEERLIEACGTAWKASSRVPLRSYALTLLPEHLISQGRLCDAAELLGDGTFLLARLRANPTTTTVHITASETIALGPRIDNAHPASDWRRFWAETESRVAWAVGAKGLSITVDAALTQLAHDRFGAEAAAFRSLKTTLSEEHPRLSRPVKLRRPALIRSLDRAHVGVVGGVLALEEGLVSWGGDGAIRFWSREGTPQARDGVIRAHADVVRGVLALEDELVSWGGDGSIRFWSRDGEPRTGGDSKAHARAVRGVLALEDELVSWGRDGAIRFWSRDGAPRAGGDLWAHEDGVEGVLALGDGLVSWGRDGAIRFWSRDGAPRAGGDRRAHTGIVKGVLILNERLVSWGRDGAIRFWSRDGAPRAGGASRAHAGAVTGMLAFGRLVSWGEDGAFRFWDQDGSLRTGGSLRAHAGMIKGMMALKERLVSWGVDGAFRFWNQDGAPLAGGDLRAHAGAIEGVQALEEGLVSLGGDGALRFWSFDGAPRAGGDPKAHVGSVWGVLGLEEALVSWGRDGALRFWSRNGAPEGNGGVHNAHKGAVGGILALDERLVSWGRDGAILFWSRDGASRAGGDLKAHAGAVRGMLGLEDKLVSWGVDGTIRFWSRDGTQLAGNDLWAHKGGVEGVLALGDGLVSWGRDGTIRFSSRDGSPRAGGDHRAHTGVVRGVLALGERLVSWGRDGAIRFCSRGGAPRAGGGPNAHKGGVGGVLTLGDKLVSWGMDGAIRFWSLDGSPRAGGDLWAHVGIFGVGGVLALGNGLVSWGEDGAIRFWSQDGTPQAGGDPRAHDGAVAGVLALEEGLVSWGGDGAIRFWSQDGTPQVGGDPRAHQGGVDGVVALKEILVSWGSDEIIRIWDSKINTKIWISPVHIENILIIKNDVWISIFGSPYRLVLN